MQRCGAWWSGLRAGICLLLVAAGTSEPAVAKDVAVVNIGWHTGIALKTADIDRARIPESETFENFSWIEFGWGDRDFYQTPDPDISVYFSAAFVGTPTVMHLVGLPIGPEDYFRSSEVAVFSVTDLEHARLQDYIAGSFARRDADRAPAIAHGLYPDSLFYEANGSFSLANTCNSWVARGLAGAGLMESGDGIVTAGSVIEALRSALERRRTVVER